MKTLDLSKTVTVVRPATLGDADLIVDAFECYLQDVAEFGHDARPNIANARSYWLGVFGPAIRQDMAAIFIAEHDEKLVGALFWVLSGNNVHLRRQTAYDHGIWVMPVKRRQGIATLLRLTAIEFLRKRGVEACISTIMEGNIAGLESYKAVGGRVIGYLTEIPIAKGAV